MDESASEVDDLLKSVGTLEVYKALASEAYVSQAYSDPVDRSFELGVILHKLSMVRTWYLICSLLLNDSIKEIVSDSNNIFLWHESEDISKKYIFKISVDSNFAFSSYDYVCFIAPTDYCVAQNLVYETFCENYSHFMMISA